MVATPSAMTALGTAIPQFTLCDADGTEYRVLAGSGAPTLIAFICNHCPYVIHIAPALGQISAGWIDRGVQVIAVNSNDFDAYPDDAPTQMGPTADRFGWTFPYLVDRDQEVARAFGATCTPDFFLFDRSDRLAYRGQFDASRPRNAVPVSGGDLNAAVQSLLDGRPVSNAQIPSLGCNIKWRSHTDH